MIYTDPTKRHDFVYLFDVVNGNPNGDPDAGNLPRIDPETMHGLVTDVALKRKIRDYAALEGKAIFIQSQAALNSLILKAFRQVGVEPPQISLDDEDVRDWFLTVQPEGFELQEDGKTLVYLGESTNRRTISDALLAAVKEEAGEGLRKKLETLARELANAARSGKSNITSEKREEARDKLCRTYYDIRMFGAVLATGLNAGQVRGPMQLTFARSIDPILPMDLTITRQAKTTLERMEGGTTEMGRKPIVPYGLYRAHGFYSPFLAEKTGVTEEDLKTFWDALLYMFEYDRSASRGQMSCRGLYIFTHDNKRGNTHAHKLFERIRVSRREGVQTPRDFSDYTVEVDETALPAGVALTKLYHDEVIDDRSIAKPPYDAGVALTKLYHDEGQ